VAGYCKLTSVIEALKYTLRAKMVEELKEKADKGEATAEDAMAALMLAAIMKKESEKINKHE
jgi:predicted transcriptional regulator